MPETGTGIIIQNYADIRARAAALETLNAHATAQEIAAFVEGAKWVIRAHPPATDAARYRYLRNDDGRAYHGNPDFYPYAVKGGAGETEPLTGADLDAAVDRALATPMQWNGEPVTLEKGNDK